MYTDILCVGLEQPLTIGRPTNFVDAGGFLCIFGSRYHFGVRTFVFKGSRYLNVSLSICLFAYMSKRRLCTFWIVLSVSFM